MSNYDAFLQKKRDEANAIWFPQESLWQALATGSLHIALLRLHQKYCVQFGTRQSEHCQEIGDSPEKSNPND